jgi:glucose/arabinose dehydrogenase
MIYTGDKFPEWQGSAFAGGMAKLSLSRLALQDKRVANVETMMPQVGRIRDVRQGPDGFIYLVTEDRDGKPTSIVRMEPVSRGPIN